MNTRYYMVIIKGEIKTSEIMSCGYNRNTQKWDVKFNNGKTYSYAYLNVEKLTDPEVLNPNMYRISREGREFFDVKAFILNQNPIAFFSSEINWHSCHNTIQCFEDSFFLNFILSVSTSDSSTY